MDCYTDQQTICVHCGKPYRYAKREERWVPGEVFGYDRHERRLVCPNCGWQTWPEEDRWSIA